MRIFLSTLAVFFSFNAVAQRTVFEEQLFLKPAYQEQREIFPAIDAIGEDMALFVLDKEYITTLLFDDFKMMRSFVTPRPKSKFQKLLGYTKDGYTYHLFYANGKTNTVLVQSIDAYKQTVEEVEMEKLNKQRQIGAVSQHGYFYLITQEGYFNSGWLNDLWVYKFKGSELIKSTKMQWKSVSDLQIIDNKSVNPLDMAILPHKLFYSENYIYMTDDSQLGATKILKISFEDLANSTVAIKNDLGVCINPGQSPAIKSNSFVRANMIFQLVVCKEGLALSVSDITSKQRLKHFQTRKDENLTFSNTPLFQEGGALVDDEGKTLPVNRALRRIRSGSVGVSVYQQDYNLHVLMGGIKEILVSGGVPMGAPMGGGSFATPYGTANFPGAETFNPVGYGYGSYANTRSVYFKSLLNPESLEHLEGYPEDNVFDRIEIYKSRRDEDLMTAQTVFRRDKDHFFAYYDKKNKKMVIVRFGQN